MCNVRAVAYGKVTVLLDWSIGTYTGAVVEWSISRINLTGYVRIKHIFEV